MAAISKCMINLQQIKKVEIDTVHTSVGAIDAIYYKINSRHIPICRTTVWNCVVLIVHICQFVHCCTHTYIDYQAHQVAISNCVFTDVIEFFEWAHIVAGKTSHSS